MSPPPRMRAGPALALFAAVGALLVGFGPLLLPLGLIGLVIAQAALIGAPALVAARLAGPGALRRLGVVAPRRRAVLGALLVGASFWYLNLVITLPLAEELFGDPRELDRLSRHLFGGGEGLALRLLAVAVAPALCEELLLRGAIGRALRPALGLAGAIAASALLFAALHLSPVRLLPTALFGVVLGYAALAGGSTSIAMLIHLVNNATAVLLATSAAAPLHAPLERYPLPIAALALALTVGGLALIRPAAPAGAATSHS